MPWQPRRPNTLLGVRSVLLTGFEPFGESAVNPSQRVVELVSMRHARSPIARGMRLHVRTLPVVGGTGRGSARAAIRRAIAACRPDAVICVGEAASRSAICIEQVAFNVRNYRMRDNRGVSVRNAPVIKGAPRAIRASAAQPGLALAMRRAMQGRGCAVRTSQDAGRFLCNEVLFDCLHRARAGQVVGFIHVPQTPAQARRRGLCGGRPLPARESARAVIAALRWICSLQ